MDKIPFEDGEKTQDAYVTLSGQNYPVTDAVYQGTTPLSAYNLNQMQDNIEEAIDNINLNNTVENKTISSGTTISDGYQITLTNSYIVGDNSLEVYWNGVLLKKITGSEDGHYKEVGTAGSSSNKIQFYRTSDDGSYTLTENVILTVIIRKVYKGGNENEITRRSK